VTGGGVRVLIADDHPVFRDGLGVLLGSLPDIEVVGSAEDGESAMAAVLELEPDVVLMDLRMPGLNGIEATRRITELDLDVGVIILTMFDDDESVFAAMRAGAQGYVLKEADPDDIRRAILAVADGDAIFGRSVARRVMQYFSRTGAAPRAFPELTEREVEVLDLVAQGLSNSEITQRLVVSPKTVRNHLTNIFAKLHVADRSEAIVRAREAGLGTRPDAAR
jgi:DNA-binding NarL/FixJ family response regulator